MHLLIDLLLKNLNILEPKDFNFITLNLDPLTRLEILKSSPKVQPETELSKNKKKKRGFYKGFSRNGEKLIKHNINFESLPPKKE